MERSDRCIALVYVSSATSPLGSARIDRLIARSCEFNESVGVSGVLLHHDGSFLQYLEGPPDGVAQVWVRVARSGLHHGITELMREPIDARRFCDWRMGFAEAPQSELQRMAQAQWLAGAGRVVGQGDDAPGLVLLADFWRRSRRGRTFGQSGGPVGSSVSPMTSAVLAQGGAEA